MHNFSVKIARKIEEIPRHDWDSIFPDVLENYGFFRALDNSGFDQFSFFYIVIYDNNKPVAVTSCFIMRFPFDMTVKGKLKTLLGFIKRIFPNILSPRVLICGLPMGQGRIGLKADSPEYLDAVCKSMEKIAREQKVSAFIFKDFFEAYTDRMAILLNKGFIRIESIPSADMDINFSTFEEYLNTLSQSSREDLRRKLRKTEAQVKIDLEVTDNPSESDLAKMYELYLQTYNKQDLGLEKLPPGFFKSVSENMPGEVKYFIWRIEGKMVSFAFCLIRGNYFIDYYLGFDYSIAHKYNLYFIRFRDLLKWCIANGVKKYEMGVTTYEPKRRLGFDFVRLYFYIKHRNRLINPFLKIIGHFIKPENFDPVFDTMDNNDGSS